MKPTTTQKTAPQIATKTFRLSLYVTYDTNHVSDTELVNTLNAAAEHLADVGLLSGETNAEVIQCTHEVQQTYASAPTDQTV